jgi:hypothetical protein
VVLRKAGVVIVVDRNLLADRNRGCNAQQHRAQRKSSLHNRYPFRVLNTLPALGLAAVLLASLRSVRPAASHLTATPFRAFFCSSSDNLIGPRLKVNLLMTLLDTDGT